MFAHDRLEHTKIALDARLCGGGRHTAKCGPDLVDDDLTDAKTGADPGIFHETVEMGLALDEDVRTETAGVEVDVVADQRAEVGEGSRREQVEIGGIEERALSQVIAIRVRGELASFAGQRVGDGHAREDRLGIELAEAIGNRYTVLDDDRPLEPFGQHR